MGIRTISRTKRKDDLSLLLKETSVIVQRSAICCRHSRLLFLCIAESWTEFIRFFSRRLVIYPNAFFMDSNGATRLSFPSSCPSIRNILCPSHAADELDISGDVAGLPISQSLRKMRTLCSKSPGRPTSQQSRDRRDSGHDGGQGS